MYNKWVKCQVSRFIRVSYDFIIDHKFIQILLTTITPTIQKKTKITIYEIKLPSCLLRIILPVL